jgi:addiction module HigA family antidote
VLLEEFLKPLDMSAARLADALGVPHNRISSIVSGDRDVSVDTAMRLAVAFGTSPQFWLNLQQAYDIRVEETNPENEAARAKVRRLPTSQTR